MNWPRRTARRWRGITMSCQVSVNHRLNVLGFLDVSEIGGPAYADSVNVGMTDLVAALRWVARTSPISAAIPTSVMIYGQSGGGSKVTTSDGHAVGGRTVPSRVGAVGRRRQYPRRRAIARAGAAIMKELGLGANDLAALQKMDWAKLNAAGKPRLRRSIRRRRPRPARAGAPAHAACRVVAHRRRQDRHTAFLLSTSRRRFRRTCRC